MVNKRIKSRGNYSLSKEDKVNIAINSLINIKGALKPTIEPIKVYFYGYLGSKKQEGYKNGKKYTNPSTKEWVIVTDDYINGMDCFNSEVINKVNKSLYIYLEKPEDIYDIYAKYIEGQKVIAENTYKISLARYNDILERVYEDMQGVY